MATVYIGQAVCSWSAPVSGGAVVTYTTKFGTASGGPESAPSNEVQYTAIADVPTVAYRYTLVQFAGR